MASFFDKKGQLMFFCCSRCETVYWVAPEYRQQIHGSEHGS